MASKQRIPIVGVIGGDDQSGCARLVGRELAKNGCVVLTGGCAVDNRTETKYAAIMGTLDAERCGEGVSRYIGILPNTSKTSFVFEYLSPRQLVIHSGLSSMDRDPLNGITPDVLVCFAGGPGTICELVFGIASGREAIFHGDCAKLLLDKCTTGRQRAEIKRGMLRVLANWQPYLSFLAGDGNTIIDILIEYLRKAVSRKPLMFAPEIVQAALQALPNKLSDVPAFPGLPCARRRQQVDEFTLWWKSFSQDSTHEEIQKSSATR
ncbi:unnamed protein product [Rotaria sp. Silwood2]|nr:unnamed protein product [Rotaria sp. Silwood2]CAF2585404.1 unnamed protein product [Rotaria sp. Silwood2]CAF2997673.1 unnamed protein product [Rotaria sp. Silwood2]CAF3947891.1 unnamed protein product [Rotaria sp. Silwood2]CAF4322060.1 unnamed protein product [Rotaria sp. Silwood2]